MKDIHITRHAAKRILRGDKTGKRTELTPEEVTELMRQPHAYKIGRIYFVYSEVDDDTLEIITARQGRTIVTIHDTKRRDTRVPDMIARARSDTKFEFTEPEVITSFGEGNASQVSLGTVRNKKNRQHITDLVDIGHVFGLFKHVPGVFEHRYLHELVMSATNTAYQNGDISKTQMKKLQLIITDDVNNYIGIMPVWVSFTLLGNEYYTKGIWE